MLSNLKNFILYNTLKNQKKKIDKIVYCKHGLEMIYTRRDRLDLNYTVQEILRRAEPMIETVIPTNRPPATSIESYM